MQLDFAGGRDFSSINPTRPRLYPETYDDGKLCLKFL